MPEWSNFIAGISEVPEVLLIPPTEAEPLYNSTSTVPWLRLDTVVVTVAVPAIVVDFKVTVAKPETAAFITVPNNIPCPVIEKVSVFVAVVIVLLLLSHILDVIKDVVVPLAAMLVGLAVFMTFVGVLPEVVITFTMP